MASPEPVFCLIVDDVPENLISMEALLRRDGVTILLAPNGPAALELMLKYDVALALLDVQMPGMDGFELAEVMRSTEKTKQVPIIFLTAGSADYQRRFRGYEAGAVDFLHKPVEADILRSKVNVFYELYRQRHEVAQQRDAMQMIAEQNKQLLLESQNYLAALREADNRKDAFLATLAHELRNPLAPIRNGLALLRDKPMAEVPEVVPMMERQLVHLVRLIDDLMDVSRVTHGKIELRNDTIPFQSALEEAMEASKSLVEEKGHSLVISVPKEPIWLMADPTRLAQILANLLNNAAKYTPPKGEIYVLANQKDGRAKISVVDNGIGIPQEMLPKVFDLFTQLQSKLDHTGGGLGIGLALVKQLVTMHGGTITAASEGDGKGTIFTIDLPLAAGPAAAAAVGKTEEEVPAPTQNILVVDDNVDSAQTTGWMLETMGHNYKLAHDGEEALAAAKTYRPHIILLDIGLPKINGYEVCKALRQDRSFDRTVLIAQTGWGQKKDRELAKDAGFDYHLVKPIDFDKLSGLINDVARSAA